MADLVTLSDVKTYLGITDNTLDALLSALISAASQFAINSCGRDFTLQTYTNEAYDGPGGSILLLNQMPIVSVASVIVDGVSIAPAGMLTSGFKFDKNAVYIVGCYGGGFTTGLQNVYITYNAGYSTIPMDLQYAVIELVAKKYRDKQKPGVGSRHIAGESIVYTGGDMTPSVRTVFAQYEKANVGLG
jgi:uncharacterized phiE125 gp8 family phage protein